MNFGFQADFDLFRERGSIGTVLSLDVPTKTPEIGTLCPVTFRTSGMIASASIDGHRRFGVNDGEIIRVQIREDRSILVRLFNESGLEVDSVSLTPLVDIPEILSLTLPNLASYDQESLTANLRTRNTAEVKITYRRKDQDENALQDTIVGNDGHFRVPLVAQPHVLVVRIELESRHAAFSPRATRVIEQQIVIQHPDPSFRVNNNPVHRFQNTSIPISIKWARTAQISYNGNILNLLAGADTTIRHNIPLVTDQIGNQQIQINVETLSGHWHQETFNVEVCPRPTQVHIEQIGSRITVIIDGGSHAHLYIPSRSIVIAIPPEGGVISHGFLFPTQAQVAITDDLGNERFHPLLLRPPEQAWGNLPTFSKQPEWRV